MIIDDQRLKRAAEELRDEMTEDKSVALIYPLVMDAIAKTPWLRGKLIGKLKTL